MTAALRMAVIGLGRMGEVHAANIATHVPGAELAAVVDADEARRRTVGARLGAPAAPTLEAALAEHHVDAVVIATPAATHAELIRAAAARGVHVLCEKPLSDDLEAAAAAARVADDAGILLQVGFQMRWDEDVRDAADRIRAGELGPLYAFRASLRDLAPPSREYLAHSAGLFADGAVHLFDLARWLAGDIVEVTAFGAAVSDPVFAELGDVDNSVVVVRFASGALGTLDNSRVAGYGFEASAEMIGDRGTLRIANHRRHHVQILRRDSVCVDHVADFLERFERAYVREIEGFAAAIGHGGPTMPSGWDGVAAGWLCEAAVRSHRARRTVAVRHDGRGRSYELTVV
jgi:predicted dehydrogenase